MRIIAAIAAVLIGFALPVAASASNRAPFDPCASRADPDAAELADLARWLRKISTVGTAALAERIQLEMTDDQSNFGPVVEPRAGAFVIMIPKGFALMHCRLVVSTWVMEGGAEDLKAPIKEQFAACDRSGESLYACLSEALDSRWSEILARGDTNAGRLKFIGGIADNAFDALLLHEFAHVVLRHDFSPRSDEIARRQEFDADVYASTMQAITGEQPFSNTYNFMFLSELLDGDYTTHDSVGCRTENAMFVSGKIAMLSVPVTNILRLDLSDHEGLAKLRPMLDDLANERGQFEVPISERSSICGRRDLSSVIPFRADLRTIARFENKWIDSFPDPADMTKSASFLRELLHMPVQSEHGKMTKLYIFSIYLGLYVRGAPDLAYDEIMEEAMAAANRPYFISKDYGRIAGLLGVNRFHRLPEKPPAGEDNSGIHALLDLAHRYNPDFVEAFTVHGLLYMREHNCAAALPQFRREAALLKGEEARGAAQIVAILEDQVKRGVCGPGA